jgi:hypothetical protein
LGNDARPLSKETITKFLQDFGLEPEFGVHSNIRGLSGEGPVMQGWAGGAAQGGPAGRFVRVVALTCGIQPGSSTSSVSAGVVIPWLQRFVPGKLLMLRAEPCVSADGVVLCAGGQKVKLVLAAAMWNNPHLLIMDEPTNYLDRVSSGGL